MAKKDINEKESKELTKHIIFIISITIIITSIYLVLMNFSNNDVDDNNNNNNNNNLFSFDELTPVEKFTYNNVNDEDLVFFNSFEDKIKEEDINPKDFDSCGPFMESILNNGILKVIEPDLYYQFNNQEVYYNNDLDMDFCINTQNEPCCFEIEE
ncbi:MAG: hypothetical protein ACOCRX_02485 [Candidatus Woesearchaeota archaeon]